MSGVKTNKILLVSSLTIQEVGEFAMQIRSAFEGTNEIHLEIDSLAHIDSAGIQLLCAICKEALAQNISLRWCGESKLLRSVAKEMGIYEWMGLHAITGS